jgi:SAM-dependent methyltransferase
LDAGCGAGTYSRILVRHGLSVIGLDYSLPTISKAVARNLNAAAFTVADVRRIPFRPGSFDGVLCFGVTQALADTQPAVQELALQLRSGGELWIDGLNAWCVVHAYDLLRRYLSRRPMHLRYESPARVKRMLKECGFTDVRLYWMPIVPSRARALQRLIEAGAVDHVLRVMPFFAKLISHAFIIHATKLPLRMGGPEVASHS